MKKPFLFGICICFTLFGYSQVSPFKMDAQKLRMEQIPSTAKKHQTKRHMKALPDIPVPDRDVDIVNIVDIGTSCNAYSYAEKTLPLDVKSLHLGYIQAVQRVCLGL